MTIEEAREIIKQFRDRQGNSSDDIEAFDMAIKVLEERLEIHDTCKKCVEFSNFEQQPCDDCISRTDILDAIETWDKFGLNAEQKLIRWQDHYVPYVHLDDVRNAIANMPSVTPTRPKGKWSRPSVVAMPYSFAYECPICRQWGNIQTFKPNYCPNCGAEMEIENEKKTC